MVTTPIDIMAEAIHAAECGCTGAGRSAAERQARAAASALTDEAIVANAVQTLVAEGYDQVLFEDAMTMIARAVLRSVGGGEG